MLVGFKMFTIYNKMNGFENTSVTNSVFLFVFQFANKLHEMDLSDAEFMEDLIKK